MEQKNELLSEVLCPYCKTENAAYGFEVITIGGKDISLGLNNCKKCKLNYVSPRLSQKGLALLYDTEYMTSTVSGKYNTQEDVSLAEYLTFKKYISKYSCGEKWKLLDIGCGVGNLLSNVRELPDITTEGVEFSEYAASNAVEKGFKVWKGDLLEIKLEPCSYDCITIMYVLEHVPQPLEVLQKSFELLRPGGYLMIAVPNYRYLRCVNKFNVLQLLSGRKGTLHPQEHLQNYTPTTINAMITSAGFEIKHHGIASPLKTGSLFVQIAKSTAWIPFFLLFKLGYNMGGIHTIARKPKGIS